jgi:putative intracellular protease/amidase
VVVLARASLLPGEASGPEDEKFLSELEQAGVTRSSQLVTQHGNLITASGPEAAAAFAHTIIDELGRMD